MKRQRGQVILLLILVMSVALTIGLSIVQKSLVDVSTASKVEQSSRAFSAAEAGIEKALTGDTNIQSFTDSSSSIQQIVDIGLIPPMPAANSQQVALEYPPLAKEDVAQFWLADYNSITNPPVEFYQPPTQDNNNKIEIYWGSPTAEKAAIEVKIIYYDAGTSTYKTIPKYFDSDGTRVSGNGFTRSTCGSISIDTTEGLNRTFYCKEVIDALLPKLMLVRMKLLYNSTSQPVAVRGYGTCGRNCSLPPQARSIVSTGVSGETQRRVKVFQENKVVPPFFDYAIFSVREIEK